MNKRIQNISVAVFYAGLGLFLSSCAKEEAKRTYEEIVLNSPVPAAVSPMAVPQMAMPEMPPDMSMGSETPLKLAWQLPVDWVEREKSGMRLAAFTSGSGANAVECTIISLGGGAGDLRANVVRWLGQINLSEISGEKLDQFVAKSEKLKTADALEGVFLDFTALQGAAGETTPSIEVYVFEHDNKNVFVKLTGTKGALSKNKEKFRSFCRSLKVNS